MATARDVLCRIQELGCVALDIFWEHEGAAEEGGGETVQEQSSGELPRCEDREGSERLCCCDGGSAEDQAKEYRVSGV